MQKRIDTNKSGRIREEARVADLRQREKWILYNFNYDNNIIDEIDEMAKYHYY